MGRGNSGLEIAHGKVDGVGRLEKRKRSKKPLGG